MVIQGHTWMARQQREWTNQFHTCRCLFCVTNNSAETVVLDIVKVSCSCRDVLQPDAVLRDFNEASYPLKESAAQALLLRATFPQLLTSSRAEKSNSAAVIWSSIIVNGQLKHQYSFLHV